MIFEFRPMRDVSMWMKGCLFPQDMLFLDDDGTVLGIVENARPRQRAPLITPGFPIASVLEINGGIAKELGIKPGEQGEAQGVREYRRG